MAHNTYYFQSFHAASTQSRQKTQVEIPAHKEECRSHGRIELKCACRHARDRCIWLKLHMCIHTYALNPHDTNIFNKECHNVKQLINQLILNFKERLVCSMHYYATIRQMPSLYCYATRRTAGRCIMTRYATCIPIPRTSTVLSTGNKVTSTFTRFCDGDF